MSSYVIGYYVSMGVSIVGLMTAIFLFFFLDIADVIRMSSGKLRRKRIKEKEVQYKNPGTSADLNQTVSTTSFIQPPLSRENTGSEQKVQLGKTGKEKNTGPRTPSEEQQAESYWQKPQSDTAVTSVLKTGPADNMTTVFNEPGRMAPTMAPNRSFKVFQNIIVVHTDEKI